MEPSVLESVAAKDAAMGADETDAIAVARHLRKLAGNFSDDRVPDPWLAAMLVARVLRGPADARDTATDHLDRRKDIRNEDPLEDWRNAIRAGKAWRKLAA